MLALNAPLAAVGICIEVLHAVEIRRGVVACGCSVPFGFAGRATLFLVLLVEEWDMSHPAHAGVLFVFRLVWVSGVSPFQCDNAVF